MKYEFGTPLQQVISKPIYYGNLAYKFKRIVGNPNFSDQFKKIITHYIKVGYVTWMPCNKLHAWI